MIETFSLKQFGIMQGYARVEKLGDRLEAVNGLIDWDRFRVFFSEETAGPGRPPYDPVLMFKMLVLQRFYSISDEELEYQVADRVSFQRFFRISQCDPGLLDGLAFSRVALRW